MQMKINIPKVIATVDMSGYAPELAGNNLYVWVNPPLQMLRDYDNLVAALQAKEVEAAKDVLLPQTAANDAQTESALAGVIDRILRTLRIRKDQQSERLDAALLKWYLEIWNQGPAETHFDIDELRTYEEQDPSFLSWMIAQTWKVRKEHIESKKKA